MNKLWAVPIFTLIVVVGLFYGGQALLLDEVYASNDTILNQESSGYSPKSSEDINILNVIFYFQFIGISNNVFITEYNNYLAECSSEIDIIQNINPYYEDSSNFSEGNMRNDSSASGNSKSSNGDISSNEEISEINAKQIAESELYGEVDLHVGSVSRSGDVWVVSVLDGNNNSAGSISIDARTGEVLSKQINPQNILDDEEENFELNSTEMNDSIS
ncbi:MAG: hypothetical protein KO202_01910 [Methanobacteriaceae archaeon]|jgi:uncharacterized membrane protein YkoI|nr:hypothetical protein [Methanobacteriaceae archaeon]